MYIITIAMILFDI